MNYSQKNVGLFAQNVGLFAQNVGLFAQNVGLFAQKKETLWSFRQFSSISLFVFKHFHI